MSVTQYIGARYVPLFADPIDWDSTREYEPLTIVYYQGNSYTSKQAVPSGIDISNTQYWVQTGNYNAQIEQYRAEVAQFNGRITENAQAIADEVSARMAADTTITGDIEAEEAARIAADTALQEQIDAIGTNKYIAIIGDSFSDNLSTEWPGLVRDETEYRIISEAQAGTGFTTGAKTFVQQLQNLSNNTNWPNVEYLIVYGGVNDWNDAGTTASAMVTAFNVFKNAYDALTHKPKMIFAFGNMGYARLARYIGFGDWYNTCLDGLKKIGMPGIVENVPYWLWGSSNVFNSDNLHPNSTGMQVISSFMLAILNGTYSGVNFQYRVASNLGEGYAILNFSNGALTLSMRITGFEPPTLGQFVQIGTASAYTWAFGDTSGADTNNRQVLMYTTDSPLKSGTNIQYIEGAMNIRTGNVYLRRRGDNVSTEDMNYHGSGACVAC